MDVLLILVGWYVLGVLSLYGISFITQYSKVFTKARFLNKDIFTLAFWGVFTTLGLLYCIYQVVYNYIKDNINWNKQPFKALNTWLKAPVHKE